MERNPGRDPNEPLDPTAAAFGDGLPDPLEPNDEPAENVAIDK
jgi:hypothetical protein